LHKKAYLSDNACVVNGLRKTVLVVDDDDAQVKMLTLALEKAGYRVLGATSPQAALAFAEAEASLDVMVTDLSMPHLDGIELTRRVQAIERYKNLPVILLTAYGSDEVHESGLRQGVGLTLDKPIELSKLIDLVGFAAH
jgi:two-component system, chemotaxis family, chemotaxis protein CheY